MQQQTNNTSLQKHGQLLRLSLLGTDSRSVFYFFATTLKCLVYLSNILQSTLATIVVDLSFGQTHRRQANFTIKKNQRDKFNPTATRN